MRLPRPNPRSLRFRATVWTAAAIAGLILVSALAIDVIVTRRVRASFDNILLEQAQDRARLLETGADPASLVTVVGEEVVAAVIGPDGRVLAAAGTSDAALLASLAPGVRDVSVAVSGDDHDDTAGDGDGTETLRVAVVRGSDGSTVVVGNEGEELRRAIGDVRAVLAIGGPAIAAVAAIVLRRITGRALRPVYRMRDDLDGVVRAGTTGRVGEPGTDDEIHDLAVTLNGVLDQLERQSDARRQFVADASHELKSPVANVRALVETKGSAEQTLSELDRLQALVDDLLYLARTDETTPTEPTVVDLDDIAFDEAERAAIRTDRHIDASGVQPAQVIADGNEVSRAVRNLLENAVRHSDRRVAVRIEESDSAWTLAVIDDGPGIPVEDRERIFTRFARLEHDRSRGQGGTGLGLSIVESIALRNHGSVRVASTHAPGARLELTLPKADV